MEMEKETEKENIVEGIESKAAPAGQSSDSLARMVASACHLTVLVGLPLLFAGIVLAAIRKEEHPFVYGHAKQAVIFQTIMLVSWVVAALLCFSGAVAGMNFVGFLIGLVFGAFWLVAVVAALVLTIYAGIKAALGMEYSYPFLGKL